MHLSIGKRFRRCSASLAFCAAAAFPATGETSGSYIGLVAVAPLPVGTVTSTINGYLDALLGASFGAEPGAYSPSHFWYGATWRHRLGADVSALVSTAVLGRSDSSHYFADPETVYRNYLAAAISLGLSVGAAIGDAEFPVSVQAGAGLGVLGIRMSDELWGDDFFEYASSQVAPCTAGRMLLSIPFGIRFRIEIGAELLAAYLAPYRIFYPDSVVLVYLGLSLGIGMVY